MKKALLSIVLLVSILNTYGQTRLPSFFGDDMVLQQKEQVAIWGMDKKNVKITVSASWGKEASTITNSQGQWKLKIETPIAGGPYQVSVKGSESLRFNNVMIGEVWLCAGQSNMEMPVKGFVNQPVIGSNEAILNSSNPNISLFSLTRKASLTPENDVTGKWSAASPETVGDFSAAAYFFAKKLNSILGVPIGLIQTAWGGSNVESWMDKETLSNIKKYEFPTKLPIEEPNKQPAVLFNGMLNPFIGYTIKGAIWYQGEANRINASEYKNLFSSMIKSWRNKWNQGDFPFYFVQIAPYKFGNENAAYLREAQMQTMQSVKNTGMAVILDVGEELVIHPSQKQIVGDRLAYWALAKDYSLSTIAYSGPVYKNLKIENSNEIKLYFDYAQNGLTSYGKELLGFEIAGTDKKFVPAKAKINKDKTIMVWADGIKKPVAVRYAFNSWVVGSLFNTNGLPASSFRTDDW